MDSNTPIIVGAGQYVSRERQEADQILSPVEIAAEAARRALADAGADSDLASHVDTLAVMRLFEHSVRDSDMWANPFGSPSNVPWSVARRANVKPRRAIYAEVGGQMPQRMVNYFCEQIHAGEARMVVLTGAEAIATIRDATRRDIELDWREDLEGEFEDQWNDEPMVSDYEFRHGIAFPIHVYALFDQVRRHELGLSLDAYRMTIAKLFAPFSAVSAGNPYAQFPVEHDTEFLATVSKKNYSVCEPYTKWMVAQDAVNQGAAVLLTSAGVARDLGIAESRWTCLAAYADVDDVTVVRRPRLAASLAQEIAVSKALDEANASIGDISHIDLYSCFPIAVSGVCAHLGIDPADSPPLTLTGGLPYFGGPGSNYSMHAIAEMVDRIRAEPDTRGIVVANGGYLSKHSVGIYSGPLQSPWRSMSSAAEQRRAKAGDSVRVVEEMAGRGRIESYAAIYRRGIPASGFIVGRREDDDARFLALVKPDDATALDVLFRDEVIGTAVTVSNAEGLNYFALAQ